MSRLKLSRLELEAAVLDVLQDLCTAEPWSGDAWFETADVAWALFGGPVRPNGPAWRRLCICLRALQRRGAVAEGPVLAGLWALP